MANVYSATDTESSCRTVWDNFVPFFLMGNGSLHNEGDSDKLLSQCADNYKY